MHTHLVPDVREAEVLLLIPELQIPEENLVHLLERPADLVGVKPLADVPRDTVACRRDALKYNKPHLAFYVFRRGGGGRGQITNLLRGRFGRIVKIAGLPIWVR